MVLRALACCSPPLPGKAIKLSFSTSPKTLSPSFDLPPMYREAELSASAGDVPSQVGRESALLPPIIGVRKIKSKMSL